MRKSNLIKLFTLIAVVVCLVCSLSVSASSADAAVVKQTLIDKTTEWKYLDNNTDPAAGMSSLTAWTEKGFDDSAWKSAAGTFGAKNGALGKINSVVTPTVLLQQYQTGTSTNTPTFFFRTTVTIDDLDNVTDVYIDAYGDDGFAVYINGNLIANHRSTAPTDSNLYYSGPGGSSKRELKLTLAVDKSYLVEGENVIAAEVHNESASSSDVYFGINELSLFSEDSSKVYVELPVLSVGADQSERNLSWFSGNSDVGEVRLVKASEVKDGAFPSTYQTFSVTSRKAVNAASRYAKSATLTGLAPDTDYAYVIVTDGVVSDIYYFETVPLGSYEFVFVGDPQISTEAHGDSWADTLQKIQDNFGVDLLVSGGDQVNTANDETLYSYVIQDELLNFTFAPTVGPGHDSSSATFSDHYNVPNKSTQYGVGTTSANYWYVYNNTLFMHLNMEDNDALFNGEHEAFIKETMEQNPDVKWTILVAHRAPYSTGLHGNPDYKNYATEVAKIRPALSALATKMDIDIVLSAHDHVYVRTYMMVNDQVSADTVAGGKVINPEGVLYITANSSTGSKFYGQQVENAYFVAKENYEKRKSAIHFEVTDTSITLTTYFMDTMEVLDTFTIEKKEVSYTPDGELVTPYGVIDEAYADKEAYPIVVFDRGGTFLSAHATLKDMFNTHFNVKSDVIVYLRRDLTTMADDEHNMGRGAGNKVIDLGGKTIPLDLGALFYAQSKGNGYLKVTLKNGTVSTGYNYVWNLGTNSSTANKTMDCTFENITFTNIGKSIVTDGAITAHHAVNSTVTFNDCTFVNPTDPLFNIGNQALATQYVIVNGGKIVMNGTTLPTVVTAGAYATNSYLTFGKGADGKYMQVITPKNSSTATVATLNPNVMFAKSESASTATESVYVLSEKTPYGYIDEEHLDATKYPMVLYLGDTVLYPDTYGEESGNTVVKQYFMDNPTKDAILYIRTDCSLGGKNYWTGNIASTFTIDLGGNTVSAGCLFYLQSRKSNAATIIVKNGTLTLAGAIAVFGTNNANNKHTDVTFENVVFHVTKSLYSIGHNNKNETSKTYTMSANVYFNNCTFHLSSSMTTALFAMAADERCAIATQMNGCTVNIGNGQYAFLDSAGDTTDTISFNSYNGKYTTFKLSNTVDVSAITEKTQTGILLGLRKTGTDGENNLYTLTPFAVTSAYVNLTNDINLVYRVYLPTGYTDPVATFVIGEQTVTVDSYTLDENGLYLFTLLGVGPQKMGDTVTVTVKATYGTKEETVSNNTVSIQSYLEALRAQNGTDEALVTLIDALLTYGAASQTYKGYNTDRLVAEIGALGTIPEGNHTLTGDASDVAGIVTYGVRLDGAFALRVGIRASDLTGLTLTVTKGENTTVIALDEAMRKGDTVVVYYDLYATELDENVTFTLTKDGAQVGKALTTSINTYLAKQQNSENAALATLVRAIYAYGVAAEAYLA